MRSRRYNRMSGWKKCLQQYMLTVNLFGRIHTVTTCWLVSVVFALLFCLNCLKNAYRIASEMAKRARAIRIGSTIFRSAEFWSLLFTSTSSGVVLSRSLIPEETKSVLSINVWHISTRQTTWT